MTDRSARLNLWGPVEAVSRKTVDIKDYMTNSVASAGCQAAVH